MQYQTLQTWETDMVQTSALPLTQPIGASVSSSLPWGGRSLSHGLDEETFISASKVILILSKESDRDKKWPWLEKKGKEKEKENRASLVAQLLGVCLPMQGTRVPALVWEDPTCRGTTKPVHHNNWACALEPMSHKYWANEPQLLSPRASTTEARAPRARAPQREKPPQREALTPQRRAAPARRN